MDVFLSESAAYKLKKLTEYLLDEWGYKVKKKNNKIHLKNRTYLCTPCELPKVNTIWWYI